MRRDSATVDASTRSAFAVRPHGQFVRSHWVCSVPILRRGKLYLAGWVVLCDPSVADEFSGVVAYAALSTRRIRYRFVNRAISSTVNGATSIPRQ